MNEVIQRTHTSTSYIEDHLGLLQPIFHFFVLKLKRSGTDRDEERANKQVVTIQILNYRSQCVWK